MWFFLSWSCVPTPNVHSNIWDCVESYAIHMLLACRLKITLASNLKLIISFLVLHILLPLSLQVVIICCLEAACSSHHVLSLSWPTGLVQAPSLLVRRCTLVDCCLPLVAAAPLRPLHHHSCLSVTMLLMLFHPPHLFNSCHPPPHPTAVAHSATAH